MTTVIPIPSHLHEILIEMFRDRPALAAELLGGPLQIGLPDYDQAQLSSADLTDVAPTEYRADAVVTLTRSTETAFAVVVEVQLRVDARKQRSWPAYVATLHARLGCPVALLVLCPHQAVADWAMESIIIGPPASRLTPVAVGPGQVPVVTDPGTARRLPELTVLSTLAHATRPDPIPLFEAFLSALDVIDSEHAALYHDLMRAVLPDTTRRLLEEHMSVLGIPYQSQFALRHIAEGEARGKAEAVLTFLAARGIEVPEDVRTQITGCTDQAKLDRLIQSAATAEHVSDLRGVLSED